MKKIIFILSLLLLTGCSINMASKAPEPVEYKKITVDTSRTETISRLGFPKITSKKGEYKIDTYEFFDGYNSASKIRILLYLAGDIFTLGLSEFIFWPLEANLFDGNKCRGTVVYDGNDKVVGYDLLNNKSERIWHSSSTIDEILGGIDGSTTLPPEEELHHYATDATPSLPSLAKDSKNSNAGCIKRMKNSADYSLEVREIIERNQGSEYDQQIDVLNKKIEKACSEYNY